MFRLFIACALILALQGKPSPKNETSFVTDTSKQEPEDDLLPMTTEERQSPKKRVKRLIKIHARLWPNKTVPYTLHPDLNSRAKRAIIGAINEYKKHTCVQFEKVNFTEVEQRSDAVVTFYPGKGCTSFFGYYGRPVKISIGKDCEGIGTVMHEIGHAIGLKHEHQRPDRNRYVDIDETQIEKGYAGAFSISEGNVLTPYDFKSIMHYSRKAFSKGGKTIIATDKKNERDMGQKFGFSSCDRAKINLWYECDPENFVTHCDITDKILTWKEKTYGEKTKEN